MSDYNLEDESIFMAQVLEDFRAIRSLPDSRKQFKKFTDLMFAVGGSNYHTSKDRDTKKVSSEYFGFGRGKGFYNDYAYKIRVSDHRMGDSRSTGPAEERTSGYSYEFIFDDGADFDEEYLLDFLEVCEVFSSLVEKVEDRKQVEEYLREKNEERERLLGEDLPYSTDPKDPDFVSEYNRDAFMHVYKTLYIEYPKDAVDEFLEKNRSFAPGHKKRVDYYSHMHKIIRKYKDKHNYDRVKEREFFDLFGKS